MKKTVALFAVAGLAAATSDFQDDYLALRLTRPIANATLSHSHNRTNTTAPIKPIRPIGLPRFPARNSTERPRPHPRPELVKLMREAHKGHQNTTRQVPRTRPVNSTHTKPAQPKVKPTLLHNDDEYFVEFDDEFYAEDDEFYAEDDELFAEDDEFFAAKNATNTTRPVLSTLPAYATLPHGVHVNGTVRPRPRPSNSTHIPKPLFRRRPVAQTNSTKHAAPLKPTRLPIKPATNTTRKVVALDDDEYWVDADDEFYAEDDEFYAEDDEFYAEDDEFYAEDDEFFAGKNATNTTRPVFKALPVFTTLPHANRTRPLPVFSTLPAYTTLPHGVHVNGTVRPRPAVQPRPSVRPVHKTNSTRPVKPIKPATNTTRKVVALDDDEYWVDIDDEFYAEDDEFYAEDDEFYAEDDEYFMNADDDFYAARHRNQTETVKPKRNATSTLEHLKQILRDGKKEVQPAVKKIKETAKNVTAHVKDTVKNATKPAAPQKGFLSMF